MTTIRVRLRGWLAALAATTLVTGLLVGFTSPAQAEDPPTEEAQPLTGVMRWGFREDFRTYVAGSTNASAPVAERIAPVAPATFDPPLTKEPERGVDVAHPYRFPATEAKITDADNLTLTTQGGVRWTHQGHCFTVGIDNVTVAVTDGEAQVLADTFYEGHECPGMPGHIEPGEITESGVVLANTQSVEVNLTDSDAPVVDLQLSDLTLTEEADEAFGSSFGAANQTIHLDDLEFSSHVIVEVSNTVADADGTTTVTVTGQGFTPEASLATRPPLGAGNPGGSYVVFGKFADEWRLSEGATSSARTVGVQKWAVLAANMASIGGENAGAVELGEDGSFETEVVIDKAATDAEDPPVGNTNYGIYTYSGGGGENANYETYTPITFLTSDAKLELDETEYSTDTISEVPVAVTVTSNNEFDLIDGDVSLILNPGEADETVLDSVELDATGQVELTIPAGQSAGTVELVARYTPDAAMTSADPVDSAVAELNVESALPDVKVELDKSAYETDTITEVPVTVTVKSGNVLDPFPGEVKLISNPDEANPTVLGSVEIDPPGQVELTIPAGQSAGTSKLVARYTPEPGSDSTDPVDSAVATLSVTQAAPALKVSLSAAQYVADTVTEVPVRATVASTNVVEPYPGKVQLIAKQGAKETVLGTTTLAAGGVANFTIPAGQKAGNSQLLARYTPAAGAPSTSPVESTTATLRVTKARTAMKAKANKKARQKAAVRVNVQTGKGNPAATGRAVLRLKQGKKVRVFRKKLNAKGNTRIVLNKKQVRRLFRQSNRPKWKGRVVYRGSAVYQKVHRPVVARVKAKTNKKGKRIFIIKLNVRK